MTTSLSPAIATRLEKVAVDNGFDREMSTSGAWLTFASTQCPLHLWLTTPDEITFLSALSLQHVADGLADLSEPVRSPSPEGAVAVLAVASIQDLHRLVRRAFQLSRALPDELLHRFEKEAAGLPRKTEAERLVVQRIGQNVFRDGLIDYWEGRCAITGLTVTELLRASHIKPWASCGTDTERLDVFNGFLLAPNLDAAFDCGFVSVADDGEVLVSEMLMVNARHILGLTPPLRVSRLEDRHRAYLRFHREVVWRPRN